MDKNDSERHRGLYIRDWSCVGGILFSVFVLPDVLCKVLNVSAALSRPISILAICIPMYAIVRPPKVSLRVWMSIVGSAALLFYLFTMFEVTILHRKIDTLF